jgi:NAD(P)-dependent dehydrogenase (short-subunit alcohol dehydrogenase family)
MDVEGAGRAVRSVGAAAGDLPQILRFAQDDTSPMILHNRCALVTGAAVRVGRAIASALAEQGMRVVVHYNSSRDAADELVEEIRAGGGEAVAVYADLSLHADVERLAERAESAFGGVDVLVNNASIFPEEGLDEVDEELWDETIAINLKAPFFLTGRIGAAMRQRGSGVIVNLADLAGLHPWRGYAAHGISKAGLLHLTRVAALSLAPEVRVAAIAPGTVLPPEGLDAHEVERLARRAPLRRNGSPDDVVHALLYLLRADFVTGEVLRVDGGRLLR